MSCPHGNGSPAQCSQCIGFRKVKKVVKVGEGLFSVGGKLINRAAPQKQANYGSIGLAPVQRCTHCRKAGHKTEDCRDKYNLEAVEAAKKAS